MIEFKYKVCEKMENEILSKKENYLYFTLPMALNDQRNSYKLWESAYMTYTDEKTRFIFSPEDVIKSKFEDVQLALTKYKLALQKNKQTEIGIKLCNTFLNYFNGDIRNIFSENNYDVNTIRNFIQKSHKKDFPYLSGTKICNYWLYVIYQYTNISYKNLEYLTVAPDTHVIKSSQKLGIIKDYELNKSNIQEIIIDRWNY